MALLGFEIEWFLHFLQNWNYYLVSLQRKLSVSCPLEPPLTRQLLFYTDKKAQNGSSNRINVYQILPDSGNSIIVSKLLGGYRIVISWNT